MSRRQHSRSPSRSPGRWTRILRFAAALAPLLAGAVAAQAQPAWVTRSPDARGSPAMAYDAARQRVVLFGASLRTDTWEWDGSVWTRRTPANSPPWRWGHAMAYDIARGRVVLFGGFQYYASAHFADTWEWDLSLIHI